MHLTIFFISNYNYQMHIQHTFLQGYRALAMCATYSCTQNSLLSLLGVVGISSMSSSGTRVEQPRRASLIRAVLKRLTMADASNFYNLASLESSVFTLLRLTSRY